MKKTIVGLAFAAFVLSNGAAFAATPEGSISKEDAAKLATEKHPGEVVKVYQETKKGVDVWEVKIKGKDGHHYEVYYKISDGSFVSEKQE